MLTHLSIRDVVLIERLDLPFHPGLTVLTGETGAGKSILLDSLGLTLGDRASGGLVRAGADQAAVSACFEIPDGIRFISSLPSRASRLTTRTNPSCCDALSRPMRAHEPMSTISHRRRLLRRIAALLVEIQGQHDQMGLADQATHLDLLDAFGVERSTREAVARSYRRWIEATAALAAAQSEMEATRREEDWLRQAVDDLGVLAPQEDEEEQLAALRIGLQQGERRGEAIAAALAELTPRDRRSAAPAAALRSASRTLARLLPAPGEENAPSSAQQQQAQEALVALEKAEEALAEAETLLSRLAADADTDPRLLEETEERLFALRAAVASMA